MTIDIGYPNFEQDCAEIFKPFLYNFGFVEMKSHPDDFPYTKYYRSMHWVLEISMLSSFPHVGVGFVFCSLEKEETRPSIIENMLAVDRTQRTAFYKKYDAENDLNDFRTNMYFAVEIMRMFYQKVLKGAVTFQDYQEFMAENEASKA